MIVLLVLLLFISSVYYVLDTYSSVRQADLTVEQFYFKEQAYQIFMSALPVVIDSLKRDDPSVDSLQDRWAYPISFKTQKGELSINIYDEERFLNLNYVDSGAYGKFFERLLRLLNIDPSYKDNLLAWEGKSNAHIDTDYPIKRGPLDSKEELLWAGFKSEDLLGKTIGNEFYPGLLSLTTVYSSGKININTANSYILMALDPRIDQALASKIIERRNREPFKKVEDLLLVDGFTFDILYAIKNLVDVKSNYFHIVMDLRSGGYTSTFEVIYDRQGDRIVYKKIL
ncbi:MAG: general secretion pathway protein GspK [Hydrogenobacter thermophilus]|uniref:general secretion pathway protein GspK n=1 Tax=Hydrogenobacter thermophilus TaxID=940 RepID=UPI001C794B27|nr:type II secretion system protein GspK [Hydrogenobacter thermophilus]QWK19320.1 MAG: general secretion pathway protein GspK [Hydrogenobacter thermophilus]